MLFHKSTTSTLENPIDFIPNNEIPKGKIMQISISPFQPHQSCPLHQHYDLWEVFIVDEGEIDITVDDTVYHLKEKDGLIVKPHHNHALVNQTDSITTMFIIGIACPESK